jgi:hypothetical protein
MPCERLKRCSALLPKGYGFALPTSEQRDHNRKEL